jgi:hypothetical protein
MPNKSENTARQDIVAFLNSIGNVHADRVNPAFKSKYASLAEILSTVKGEAAKHNLAVAQTITSAEGQVRVSTTFLHVSGENHEAGTLAFLAPSDAQKLGSALTYLRRQSLQTACGISTDIDDDGAKASQPPMRSTVSGPWYDFIPADQRPKAVAYLKAKTWLTEGDSLSDLPIDYQSVVAGNQPAFLKAINK